MLQIPDGFIFQLWSKERVELGQNCNQPKEIAANRTGHQHGNDNSPVRTLRDEPRHQEADEAPEHAHHNERHREALIRHGHRLSASPYPAASLGFPGRKGI